MKVTFINNLGEQQTTYNIVRITKTQHGIKIEENLNQRFIDRDRVIKIEL